MYPPPVLHPLFLEGGSVTAAPRFDPARRPPDVIVVVLDTVRRDVLSGGAAPAPSQPTLDALRESSWVHPRALAPSPWTAPSHASLFTGTQPWEHRVHLKGQPRLTSGAATLAGSLRELGYRTASFAANNFVGPLTGLEQGFEQWWVGGKQDWLLRGFAGPPTQSWKSRHGTRLVRLAHFGLQEPMWSFLSRRPGLIDKVAPVFLQRRPGPTRTAVASWIDEELRAWLAGLSANEPAFVFVNYMEAHEPYFGLPPPEGAVGPSARAVRQDSWNWAVGSWDPSEEQLASLRSAYRRTFPVLDARLANLIRILEEAGRWRNSLFLLTSDHGQALGDSGVLFHGIRTAESLLRVPLWIRPPPHVAVPLPTDDWVSLTSVRGAVETMVRSAIRDGENETSPSGGPEPPRLAEPIAFSDGLGGVVRPHVPPARLQQLDRLEIAGYVGSRKLVLDVPTGRCSLVDLATDPGEAHPSPIDPSGDLEGLYRSLRAAAQQAFPAIAEGGATVDSRLASWGYV
jgi:arylsulfatase A-like enzyme